MAEEVYGYDKDEWEKDYNTKEKELLNIVESEDESQENDEPIGKNAKNNYFTKMYIEGVFSWKKNKSNSYLGKINSHIFASYYEAFLSFSSTLENTIALRFSPILMYYPKKHKTPVLSLYLGNFNSPLSFKNVYNPVFSSITATSNRKLFPPLNAIKIAEKNTDEGIALEVSLPFFNYYSFWKNTKKGNIFNTYISYKNNFSNFSHLNIALLSSIQEIKKENLKKNPYLQIYGADFNFSSPIFYINSLSLITILPKRIPSFSSFAFRTESGLTSHIASLNGGISYKGAYYLGNQNLKNLLQKRSFLNFYLQGKIKYKIFQLNGVYQFIKDYKYNKTKHFYGIFYSLGNSFISYKNEVSYKNEIYKLKFSLTITPNINYFKFFNISSFLYLQDRKINPHCIKKYELASKYRFTIAKCFNLIFSFAMMQEKNNWQKIAFLASTTATLNFKQEKTKEKGEIKLKYNSKENKLEATFKFRVEY